MLFGRDNELKALKKLYDKESNDAVIVYGNSENCVLNIIKEFINDKEFFYYNALPVSKEFQINSFQSQIIKQLNNKQILDTSYLSILKAMLEIKCEKRIIVINNFQHIIKFYPEFIDDVLKCLTDKWNNQKVLFLLVSDNPYFVENQMLAKLNENAYELSGLIKIDDISFIDFLKYFKKYNMMDLITAYSIIGGKAKYIEQWNPELSLKQNLLSTILNCDSYLYAKGCNILPMELREPTVYNTILLTIASGKEKLNDIHKSTGYSRAKISVYLNNLADFDIIEKIDSFDSPGRDNALKGIYKIKDSYISFFYKFIFPNISELTILDENVFYEKYIENKMTAFSETAFKNICVEYLKLLNALGRLPYNFIEFGTFLGKVGNIDIVAEDRKGNNLIGLCSFENETITLEDFEWLCFCVKQAKLSDDVFYLFSRGNFDSRLVELSKERNNIYLIDLSML